MPRTHALHPQTRGPEAPDARLEAAIYEAVFRSQLHQPLSRGRVSARDGVVDRMTGARGVSLQVTRLTWVHASAVDVLGGY
jgi:hypothetical protein